MCLCMCMYMCTYLYVSVHTWMCMEIGMSMLIPSLVDFHFIFEKMSLRTWSSSIQLGWLISSQDLSLLPQHLDYRCALVHLTFYVGPGVPNSGPHACIKNI